MVYASFQTEAGRLLSNKEVLCLGLTFDTAHLHVCAPLSSLLEKQNKRGLVDPPARWFCLRRKSEGEILLWIGLEW